MFFEFGEFFTRIMDIEVVRVRLVLGLLDDAWGY
jgi:hypothetical protein